MSNKNNNYLKIAVILTLVTVVEVMLPSWSPQTVYNVLLLSLAALKFWLVIQVYMHLKKDPALLGWIFGMGVFLIAGSAWAIIVMLNPNAAQPSPRSEVAHQTPEVVEIEVANPCHTPDPTPTNPCEGGEVVEMEVANPCEGGNALTKDEMIALGETVATQLGCSACHSVDGSRLVGPSWKGLLGREQEMDDGTTIIVDTAYIRESVLDPMKRAPKGFIKGMMPMGLTMTASDEEVEALLHYLASL
ncbi:cytochrome C oxidase subunit IV family protein [bacterium]|nr:cytochrome C oxidase subunit IV family protein [bacterium]